MKAIAAQRLFVCDYIGEFKPELSDSCHVESQSDRVLSWSEWGACEFDSCRLIHCECEGDMVRYIAEQGFFIVD